MVRRPFPAPYKNANAAATRPPLAKPTTKQAGEHERCREVEVQRVQPAAEQHLGEPCQRLADTPQRCDPDGRRRGEAEPREHADHVRRHAGIERVGGSDDDGVEQGRRRPPAPGGAARGLAGWSAACRASS